MTANTKVNQDMFTLLREKRTDYANENVCNTPIVIPES